MPDVLLYALDAVCPDDEPQLQCSESASKRHLPVSVVDHESLLPGISGRVIVRKISVPDSLSLFLRISSVIESALMR